MKRLSTILFLFLPLLGIAQDSTEVADRIYWSDWYRLEWSDFQAEASDGDKVAALSNIALPYEYTSDGEGQLKIEVQVCFLKKRSWSKENQRNKLLLQHEQLHFDIAELHRRLIVKALLEADFNKHNYEDLIKEIVTKYWLVDYRSMQDKYDLETNYSRVVKGQINWNKYVKQQLINLEEYKYTELDISLITLD